MKNNGGFFIAFKIWRVAYLLIQTDLKSVAVHKTGLDSYTLRKKYGV
jgi:hypothetical protein